MGTICLPTVCTSVPSHQISAGGGVSSGVGRGEGGLRPMSFNLFKNYTNQTKQIKVQEPWMASWKLSCTANISLFCMRRYMFKNLCIHLPFCSTRVIPRCVISRNYIAVWFLLIIDTMAMFHHKNLFHTYPWYSSDLSRGTRRNRRNQRSHCNRFLHSCKGWFYSSLLPLLGSDTSREPLSVFLEKKTQKFKIMCVLIFPQHQ